MVKKTIRMLCCMLLLILLPCAAMAGDMVVDDAGLFTSAEVDRIETLILRIREDYQMDVVVVTSRDVGYNDSQRFADQFYEDGGYGLGEDHAGLLYLIDMRNRIPYISTTGVMIDYITDSRLESLFDCSYDALAEGEYGRSTLQMLQRLEKFLKQGRQEGSFRYDAQTGQRLSGLYNTLTIPELLTALGCGAVVAAVMALIVLNRYSMKGGSFRCENAADASCRLTVDEETFLRQNVVRTRNAPPPDGGGHGGGGHGSGVHTSSSGTVHGGGGGRKF